MWKEGLLSGETNMNASILNSTVYQCRETHHEDTTNAAYSKIYSYSDRLMVYNKPY